MKFTLRREGKNRHWPDHVLWGRMRTSTLVLIVAFLGTWWVYETYKPQPEQPAPETQVVPPGFVPDPEYTWVPRTQVQPPRTTYPTTTEPTTTEPTSTEPTTTTTPTDGPDPFTPGQETSTDAPTTTVIDPDGPGLIPPLTLPVIPPPAPAPQPAPQIAPGTETSATPPPPARSAS